MKRHGLSGGVVALACAFGVTGAAFAQEQASRRIHTHAAVGQTVRLSGHVNYRPCGTVIPTTIIVVRAPTHGTLTVRDEMVTSAAPELGHDDKCRGHSGQGKAVYYARTSSGADVFKYESSSANGVVHFAVTVD